MGASLEKRYKDIISSLSKDLRKRAVGKFFCYENIVVYTQVEDEYDILVPCTYEFGIRPKDVVVHSEGKEIYIGCTFEAILQNQYLTLERIAGDIAHSFYYDISNPILGIVAKESNSDENKISRMFYGDIRDLIIKIPFCKSVFEKARADADKAVSKVNSSIKLRDEEFKALKSRRDFLPVFIIKPSKGGIDYCDKSTWDNVKSSNSSRRISLFNNVTREIIYNRYNISKIPVELLDIPEVVD